MALPLLPLQDVEQAYQELNEQIPVELEPLFEYFENWWMKQVPLELWNVCDLKSRTNNNVECKIYFILSSFHDSLFFTQRGIPDSTRESKKNIPTFGLSSMW
jgi:hypothetical protein